MPLALVVHATRPTADVPLADARRLVASGATRWSAIGQSGGEMRVVSTEDRRASAVLREVRTSSEVLGVVPADAVDARVRVLTVGGRHPLRDPERYPLRIRSVRPVPEVTTLTAVGDIMLGRRVGDRHRADPGTPLKPLAKRLAGRRDHGRQLRVDPVRRRVTDSRRRLFCSQSARQTCAASGRVRSAVPGQQPRRRLRRWRSAADSRPLRLGPDPDRRCWAKSGRSPSSSDHRARRRTGWLPCRRLHR